jgi:hypothetical protein
VVAEVGPPTVAETITNAIEGQRSVAKGHIKTRRSKLANCRTCFGQGSAPL